MALDNNFKDLGGYTTFESSGLKSLDQLSLADKERKLLALGRHCVEAACKALKPSVLLLPIFTCSSVKQTAAAQGILVRYYSISEAFLPQLDAVEENEMLVLNNYFGLSAYSSNFDSWLKKVKTDKILIDNTHSIGLSNQFSGRLSFVSPRKFLPVTDGGILFDPQNLVTEEYLPHEKDVSWDRLKWIFRAIDEQGRNQSYKEYVEYRKKIQNNTYSRLSTVTRMLLCTYEISSVIQCRNENFRRFLAEIQIHPSFSWLKSYESEFTPIGYPVYAKDAQKTQKNLSRHSIYTIRYWPELDNEQGTNEFEKKLLKHLLILPIEKFPNDKKLKILKSELNSI